MIKAIFAIDNRGGMSLDGHLPWPKDVEDIVRFKQLTQTQVVVMGRKTWESKDMPHPLPNRTNVVVSRFEFFGNTASPDAVVCPSSFQESMDLLAEQHPNKDIWIIGGAQLLDLAKPIITEIFLTVFNDKYPCDVEIDISKYLDKFACSTSETVLNKRFEHWIRKY